MPPIDFEYNTQEVPDYTYSGSCGGSYYSTKKYLNVDVITRQWNEPQHRPKPKGRLALISAMTNLPEQYTTTVHQGQHSYVASRDVWKYCYSGGFWEKHDTVRHNGVTDIAQLNAVEADPDINLSLRRNIKDMSTNLGTTLVEYRESAKMFKHFARSAVDAWKLMHGRLPRRRRPITPCTVASAHLVNSYGIQPLASDLFESIEVLMGRLEQPFIRKVHAYARESRRYDVDNASWRQEESHSVSKQAKAYVWMHPQSSQFGLGNPAELAWEVIPFSFVVDWALPIGGWLYSLDALKGVTGIKGCLTTKTEIRGSKRGKFLDVYGKVHVSSGAATYVKSMHRRDLFTHIPIPPVPSYKPSTSLKAVANGIALLTALNKKCG